MGGKKYRQLYKLGNMKAEIVEKNRDNPFPPAI